MNPYIAFILACLAAPGLAAVIQKVKAFCVGRQGPPLTINYHTLAKLWRKTPVYSTSTTFVFRVSPVISLAVILTLFLFFPLAGVAPILSFEGDVIALLYLLGLGRFFTIIAALDTASPFEGMGAAREAFFATLAETAVFVILVLFFRLNGSLSFAGYFTGASSISLWTPYGALLLLVIVSLFMILLTENSRIPVDDPATHLELTMLHEVMILDHSGPDLALIEMAAYLKLLFYAALIANLVYPAGLAARPFAILSFAVVLCLVYVLVGVAESITARFRLTLVPKFILTSFALAFFATILTMEFVR